MWLKTAKGKNKKSLVGEMYCLFYCYLTHCIYILYNARNACKHSNAELGSFTYICVDNCISIM